MPKTKKIAAAVEGGSLTLEEIFVLESELAGARNQDTGEQLLQGVMAQKLSLRVKYALHLLHAKALEQKTAALKLREELIKSLANGEDEQGNPLVERFVKGENGTPAVPLTLTPEFTELNKQWNELLKETRPLSLSKSLKLSDFEHIETDEYYPVFMSILEE
jgi:hypothetical protein